MIREAGGGPIADPPHVAAPLRTRRDPDKLTVRRRRTLRRNPGPHRMSSAPLDFASLLASGLPPPAVKYNGFPKYNFVGGHNDAEHVPVDALVVAATAVLTR